MSARTCPRIGIIRFRRHRSDLPARRFLSLPRRPDQRVALIFPCFDFGFRLHHQASLLPILPLSTRSVALSPFLVSIRPCLRASFIFITYDYLHSHTLHTPYSRTSCMHSTGGVGISCYPWYILPWYIVYITLTYIYTYIYVCMYILILLRISSPTLPYLVYLVVL